MLKEFADEDVNKKVILISVTICFFILPFMSTSINIALPSIGKEFAIDAVNLGWITTAYMLATAVFLVPLGKVGDIIGRKHLYTLGITFYIVMSILSTISPSASWLIIFRFF